MTKIRSLPLVALLLAAAAVPRLSAQTSGGQTQIGPVHMTFDGGRYVGASLHLSGVVLTSKDYDLQAASVVADTVAGRGAAGTTFTRIVALGDPAGKSQVTGRFVSAEQDRTYLVRGDKAVFVPVADRRNGGRVDFTGHVVVTLQAPQALDGPAVTRLEQATVLLGPAPGYPQVEFGPGQLNFTPLP